MTTFLLLHGAGGSGWDWHLVEPLLRADGHRCLAPDLPAEDPAADLDRYVQVAVDAVRDAEPAFDGDERLIVVGHSMAGVFAPMVAEALAADHLVMLAAMVPTPGERGQEWWTNTGHAEAQRRHLEEIGLDPSSLEDPLVIFGNGMTPEVWAGVLEHERTQTGRPFDDPCPLDAWPSIPTTVAAARDDRFFPLDFQRTIARDRLGLEVDVVPGGHVPALSHPGALADKLAAIAAGLTP